MEDIYVKKQGKTARAHTYTLYLASNNICQQLEQKLTLTTFETR